MSKIKAIRQKCKEEIAWAEANIAIIDDPVNRYTEEDKVWLPCWLKAHKEMLKIIEK